MKIGVNLKKVLNFESVCFRSGVLHPKTERLILLTQAVGIPEITNNSAHDFFERATAYQASYGGLVVSAEDVINHVGLSASARSLTREQFFSGIGKKGFERVMLG